MPSITCGNCHGVHSSVEAVRWCFEEGPVESLEPRRPRPVRPQMSFGDMDPIPDHIKEADALAKAYPRDGVGSEEKVYLSVPFEDKELAKPYGARWDKDQREWWVSKEDFREYQEELRPWIKREVTVTTPSAKTASSFEWTREALPEGYYALLQDGAWKFYRVSWGKPETRWGNHVFLEVQASDELYPIRNHSTKSEILSRIQADPKQAALQYGHQIGRCSVCNRTLTDENSIAAGIGPICAGKRGW
jgi:hypothetical protein